MSTLYPTKKAAKFSLMKYSKRIRERHRIIKTRKVKADGSIEWGWMPQIKRRGRK